MVQEATQRKIFGARHTRGQGGPRARSLQPPARGPVLPDGALGPPRRPHHLRRGGRANWLKCCWSSVSCIKGNRV